MLTFVVSTNKYSEVLHEKYPEFVQGGNVTCLGNYKAQDELTARIDVTWLLNFSDVGVKFDVVDIKAIQVGNEKNGK